MYNNLSLYLEFRPSLESNKIFCKIADNIFDPKIVEDPSTADL